QFWSRVYSQVEEKFGNVEVPVDTFNKVWVVADKADVYVKDNTAYVAGSHLKVMLESDYLAAQKSNIKETTSGATELAKQVVREIVLPELEAEINTGKNFANLRQIFHSMILATWYKKNLKNALLNQVYSNKSKINGVELGKTNLDPQAIYKKYVEAYKKGVFNFIREDVMANGETLPRKYFSGGLAENLGADLAMKVVDSADIAVSNSARVKVGLQDTRKELKAGTISNTDRADISAIPPEVEILELVNNGRLRDVPQPYHNGDNSSEYRLILFYGNMDNPMDASYKEQARLNVALPSNIRIENFGEEYYISLGFLNSSSDAETKLKDIKKQLLTYWFGEELADIVEKVYSEEIKEIPQPEHNGDNSSEYRLILFYGNMDNPMDTSHEKQARLDAVLPSNIRIENYGEEYYISLGFWNDWSDARATVKELRERVVAALRQTYVQQKQVKDDEQVVRKDSAMPGGIDMNSGNMKMNVAGQKIDMKLDAAMLEQFQNGDFDGLIPVIFSITSNINTPIIGAKH
ncbi:MAG: hypothetical protein HQL25_04380, partial [Candidatus Omnitrophica bacterium]|nr:hypothetical protein [Candidatus Omnitrophota bacterium]